MSLRSKKEPTTIDLTSKNPSQEEHNSLSKSSDEHMTNLLNSQPSKTAFPQDQIDNRLDFQRKPSKRNNAFLIHKKSPVPTPKSKYELKLLGYMSKEDLMKSFQDPDNINPDYLRVQAYMQNK